LAVLKIEPLEESGCSLILIEKRKTSKNCLVSVPTGDESLKLDPIG
jgi:hypothetical protein